MTFHPPAFLGAHYGELYADVARRHGAATAPSFPPGVLGHPGLVLTDRIHPNARAIDLIAMAFLPAVGTALQGRDTAAA